MKHPQPISEGMSPSIKHMLKALAWSIGFVLLVLIYFADNIQGHYRFKEICAKEGGLRLYQPLERDVGWLGNDGVHQTDGMLSHEAVAFVRSLDKKDGKWYDSYRAKRLKVGDPFEVRQPADFSKPVVYQARWIHGYLPNETRLAISKLEFVDLRTNQIAATYTGFGYSQFNERKTILAAPSMVQCPEIGGGIDPKTGKKIPSNETLAIRSSFKQ